MTRKYWLAVPFFASMVALTWVVRDLPFFWDAIQLGSKQAHHFFENGLRWSPLPPEIDSGHPPAFGFYLAACWFFFGKTLTVSHFAMLPFLLGIVWALLRLGERLGGEWAFWLLPLALLDPVLAGQMTLVGPDVALVCFFLWAIEAVFSRKKWWLALAILGLCLVSMRGMMTAGAIFCWQVWLWFTPQPPKGGVFSEKNEERDTANTPPLGGWGVIFAFLPGFFAAAAFLFWHWQAVGWVGHHPASSWSPAFQVVDFQGFLKNVAVVGWRWLDFGRVGEWLVVGWIFFILKKRNRANCHSGRIRPHATLRADGFFQNDKLRADGFFQNDKKSILILLLCLLIFLTPTALIYQNLSAHRYFLPAFLAFHLLVFQAVAQLELSFFKKNLLLAALVVALGTGNFWRYPIGISMDWDSTLAHLPYHELRSRAIDFLKSENIDFQRVGTAFPNFNCLENTDLNGDSSCFAERDFEKNDFVLWSNVFNDFSREDFDFLEKNWTQVWSAERAGVRMVVFQKNER